MNNNTTGAMSALAAAAGFIDMMDTIPRLNSTSATTGHSPCWVALPAHMPEGLAMRPTRKGGQTRRAAENGLAAPPGIRTPAVLRPTLSRPYLPIRAQPGNAGP
jgi:hypothetical protein